MIAHMQLKSFFAEQKNSMHHHIPFTHIRTDVQIIYALTLRHGLARFTKLWHNCTLYASCHRVCDPQHFCSPAP